MQIASENATAAPRGRSWDMLMGWKAFITAHARPFIIYADLPEYGGVRGSGGRQNRFALLGTLLRACDLPGAYALLPEADLVRIAFESEDAARTFARTMNARKTAREGGWAGQWSFVYRDDVMEEIKAALPPPVKRARQARAAASIENAEP